MSLSTLNHSMVPSYPVLESLQVFVEYLWLSAVVIGIPGNFLALIVSFQKENRKISTCAYIGALAVVDNVVLINFPIVYVIQFWGLAALYSSARIILLISWYLMQTTTMLSGIFLALVSVERMVVVRFPLKSTIYCTRRRAKWVIFLTTVVVGVVSLHIFYVYRFKRVSGGAVFLEAHVPEAPVVETVSTGFHLGVGVFLPLIVILVSNTVILHAVKQANQRRAVMSVTDKGSDTKYLTKMLVTVSIAYLVTSTPFRLYELIQSSPLVKSLYDPGDIYWNLRYHIESSFVSFVSSFNFAINFYLYVLGGGQRYRNDVKDLFCFRPKS